MEWAINAAPITRQNRLYLAAVFAPGILLFFLSEFRPSLMPDWGPWDFSWPEYLATALTVLWFFRGLALTPRAERPSVWRCVSFIVGLGAIYGVLQTHFDYMAQHMFFINRAQHVVMHHIGPFLIALAWAGGTIKRGMPRWCQQIVESRPVTSIIGFLQQPALAAFLFAGLFYFWLIPSIHFRAMIDQRLYSVMNWSMVLDGLLFWSLVLDPRPSPPARISFGTRLMLAIAVMFPQILLGSMIFFSTTDLFPYYDLCGRLIPSLSALDDQEIGGIMSWIPPGMMSVIGALVVLNALRRHELSVAEVKSDVASPIETSVSR